MNDVIGRFTRPDRLATRAEVLSSPRLVPASAGVYGWWFRALPSRIDTSGCLRRDGLTLLYVGISPRRPPANGRAPSRQGLRSRIRTHYTGNAEASTLRKTLGCLLGSELQIELRRVGSGHRFTFVDGEPVLSEWMARNALVSWVACERPWEVEEQLIATLDLPLNLDGNQRHVFHPQLSRVRAQAVRRAKALPVLPNPGVAGRFAESDSQPDRFAAHVLSDGPARPRWPLARLILVDRAASADRSSLENARAILGEAFRAIRRDGTQVGILATPAGFVEHHMDGPWRGRSGWETAQGAYAELAAVASSIAERVLTPALRRIAAGTVEYVVLGVDVWPTLAQEPHAEVACLYDIGAAAVRPVTGKSYPTPAQQRDLIRNPDLESHLVPIGEERVAVLVCHDLAAWSPRGNATAMGTRAATWRAMQAAVTAAGPTLAVHLPHTVAKRQTWQAAWSVLERAGGSSLRGGWSAIRYLGLGYQPLSGAIDPALVAGTGWGERALDIIVTGRPGADQRETTRLRSAPHGRSRSHSTRRRSNSMPQRPNGHDQRLRSQRAPRSAARTFESPEHIKAKVGSGFLREQMDRLVPWIQSVNPTAEVTRGSTGSHHTVWRDGRKAFSYYFANNWIHFVVRSVTPSELALLGQLTERDHRVTKLKGDGTSFNVMDSRDLELVQPILRRRLLTPQ
jgi:GIY-YIG catalytic domain